MNQSEAHYLPEVEWELLHKPMTIPRVVMTTARRDAVVDSPHLPTGVQRIIVSRGDDYQIEAIAEGPASDPFTFEPSQEQDRGFAIPFDLRVEDLISNYVLTGCHLRRVTTTSEWGPDGEPFLRFQAHLSVHEIVVHEDSTGSGTSLTEWFLNGPEPRFLYSGWGRMKTEVVHQRRRSSLRPALEQFPGASLDRPAQFIFVRSPNGNLLIHPVPDALTPDWSDCLGIEYRDRWRGIPGPDERQAIADLVSFVLGRRLLYVGSTEINDAGQLTRRSAMSPNAVSPTAVCRAGSLPPVRLLDDQFVSSFESVLRRLLPAYLRYRHAYLLQESIYRCLAAREVPLGVGIPLVQSAIEAMSKGWLSTKSKTKAVYMEKEDFHELFGPEIESITHKLTKRSAYSKLKSRAYSPRLLGKIAHAYDMSVADRSRTFYQGIDLPLGKVEEDALKSRHSFTHGDSGEAHEKTVELAMNQVAYSTLANRVILRLLRYRGSYVDYTSLEQEDGPLHEPLSGIEVSGDIESDPV